MLVYFVFTFLGGGVLGAFWEYNAEKTPVAVIKIVVRIVMYSTRFLKKTKQATVLVTGADFFQITTMLTCSA